MKNAMQLKAYVKNLAKKRIFPLKSCCRTICLNGCLSEFPFQSIMITLF